jgi:hypothetical protein
MKRQTVLVGLLGLVLVVAGAFVLLPRSNRVTRENFDRIRDGMSEDEVYAVLGRSGDYANGPTELDDAVEPLPFASQFMIHSWTNWAGDTGHIAIAFGKDHTVYQTYFAPQHNTKLSLLDRLLWRAKRQWQEWYSE